MMNQQEQAKSDSPEDTAARRFPYRLSWWEFLGRLPLGMILLLGIPWCGMWRIIGDEGWQTEQIVTMSIALLATLAVVLVQIRRVARLAKRRRAGLSITLGANELEAPQQDPSYASVRLPLDKTTRLCLVRHWCELILHVETDSQLLCIPDSAFTSDDAWKQFLDALIQETGLSLEHERQRLGQFSAATLLVLTALVALVLALNNEVELGTQTTGLRIWQGLLLLAASSSLAILLWTLPRVGRATAGHCFGVAYSIGCIWELVASGHVLKHLSGPVLPSVSEFYAWYPLTFPITRLGLLFVPSGYNIQPEHFLAVGSVLSGLLFGLAALYAWKALRRKTFATRCGDSHA